MPTSLTRSTLAAATLVACAEPAPPSRPGGEAAPIPPPASASATRDSTWVEISGPTLIAFSPPSTSAAADSSHDVETAMDDFGYYLTSALDSLRAAGVRVVSVESRTLHVIDAGRATAFRVPSDSAELGYYLVAPGRAAEVQYGAQSDIDLIEWTRRYLRRAP
jgi:hypothetical protein